MPQYQASRFVPVSPDVAYSVAADVGSYKAFLPMMTRSTVRGQRLPHGAGEQFLAELVVGYEKLGIRESFVSTVTTDPVGRTVQAVSQEGPMQNLSTHWSVAEAPGGSMVTVTIDYAFKSRMMQMAFAGILDMASGKIMQAFEDRAKAVA